jgi:hypothetical protein
LGTFSDLESASACSTCSFGTFSSVLNSTYCEFCGPGKYSHSSSSTCSQCPSGYYQKDFGKSFCFECISGTFQNSTESSECLYCSPGKFQSSPAQSSCDLCPLGRASSGFRASSCTPCIKGFYADSVGNSECFLCQPGRISEREGRSFCEACIPGKYSESGLLPTCLECPEGRYSNSTGSSSVSNCLLCPQTDAFLCPSGSIRPFVRAGYFRDPLDDTKAYQCISFEACNEAGFNLITECGEGYTGFRCDSCIPKYYKNSNQCIKCPNNYFKWVLLFIFGTAAVYILLKIAVPSKSYAGDIRAVLFSIQILAIFPRISQNWSQPMLNLFGFLSFSNMSFESLSFECDIPFTYWQQWNLKMNIPLILALMMFVIFFIERLVVYFASRRFVTKKLDPYPLPRFVYGYILLLNFVFVYLIATLVEPMNCYDVRGGAKLAVDSSISCFDSSWKKNFIGPAVLYGLLYVVCVPFLYVYLFYQNRNRIISQEFQDWFGALTRPYRTEVYWYEIISILKKIMIAVIPESVSYLYSPESKSLIAFISMLFFLILESKLRPFRTHIINQQSLMYIFFFVKDILTSY